MIQTAPVAASSAQSWHHHHDLDHTSGGFIITDCDGSDLYVAGRIEFIDAGPQMLGKDNILDIVNMLAEFIVGSGSIANWIQFTATAGQLLLQLRRPRSSCLVLRQHLAHPHL